MKQSIHKTKKSTETKTNVQPTQNAAGGRSGSHKTADRETMITKERELFLQLLKNYPDGLVSIIDRQLKFVLTGGELHRRLGVDPRQLIGLDIYPKFPGRVRQAVIEKLNMVFDGAVISDFDLPESLKGHLYVMDAFPLTENDGSIAYAGVIIRNVTHLKQAEEELRKALKKEKELGELKSRFVTMASHEFRTPLTTVLSSASLLKKYVSGDQQKNLEKHVNKIISSVNVLNDILNDFLSIGKIEEGKVIARPMQINIKESITSSIQELASIQKEGQEIFYEHKGEEWVLLDPTMLKHIINNLISNAIKFSPERSKIEVNTYWVDGRLQLTVKDEGIGIPDENKDNLFQRFYRGSNAMNIQGTGLGLHIVGKYLELMNGKIEFVSELYKGTKFIISF